jgi:outer membrane protein OmpA-like peptidoglycan-associated protein
MSDGDQFVSCLSYDGKTLYVSREDEFNSDIYVSRFADNHWSRSEPLNANINTKYWESHASVSKDGKILYFASNRKDGLGEMDIYRSTLTAVGSWGPAKNLGSGINTDLNEDTPFITADGQTLYFCGQGFANMGGYDIFRSARNPDGEWSVPENLGSPVNTPDDDLFYYPWNNGEVAYMARIMEEGYGEMDIYRITYMPKTDVTVASDEPIEEAAPVETQEISVEKPEVSVDSQTDVDEEVRPEEPVAAPRSATIVTLGLEPALFDFDRSTISVQGKTQLTKLADLMKEHNNVSVELTGYTDALGPEEYNLRLSEKRAQSARLYMISLGVEASRIKTAGKGETEFIAPNTNPDGSDNPEGRKYNRRVEFEVSGTDKEKLMIKRLNPVPEKHIQNLK